MRSKISKTPKTPKTYKTYTFKTTTPKDETPPEEPQTYVYKTIPPPVEEAPLTTPKPLSGDLVYQSEPSEPVKIFKFEPGIAETKQNTELN